MTRDASLDEFLGGGADEDGGDDDADENEQAPDEQATDAPEPDEPAPESESEAATADEGAAATDEAAEADNTTAKESPEEPPLSPASVERARSTYDWSPEGAECAACGATVEARWRDESGLVCADCKEW